jgi:ATP-dependent phosphofructokinase / diphosphate-dependent phosphofructokinase
MLLNEEGEMRLGILTGGGDVPGLNPCIKAVVDHAIDEGHSVLGIRRGWAGMLNYNPDSPEPQTEWVIPLTKPVVRTIDRTGGTFLHTSRTNPARTRGKDAPDFLKTEDLAPDERHDFTKHVLRVIDHLKLDALVPIGGDDTLSYAVRMHKEGIPVVAIPKTMDNDVFGTDYCIGFSTAVTRSVEFIHALRTPSGSHERIAVIELFGRNSGETSLIAAYLASADRAIISEVPFDPDKLARFLVEDKARNPSGYAIMTISEGAQMIGGDVFERGIEDAYGHKKLGGIGQFTADVLKTLTGNDMIYQQLAYLMRSGAPDALDRMVATSYGYLASQLLNRGVTGRMVALQEGKYTHIPLQTVTQGVKRVDVHELYDSDHYRPQVSHVLGKPMFLY